MSGRRNHYNSTKPRNALSASTFLLLTLALAALLLIIAVISLWKHKQSGTGRIQLLNAVAFVDTPLDPEGTVLIDGELWRARSLDGTTIAAQERVVVSRVEGHLLIVKR